MQVYHLTLASDGRRPLFPNETRLRQAVCTLARIAGLELVLFYVLDDHLHLVLACNRVRAGRIAQRLGLALRSIAEPSLESARIRPVEGRDHLESLISYILTQAAHHGLSHHPALWTGSCFQDLASARYLEGLHLRATIARELPRFRLRWALRIVGLPTRAIDPVPYSEVFGMGLQHLVDAGAAAAAVGPELIGRSAPSGRDEPV